MRVGGGVGIGTVGVSRKASKKQLESCCARSAAVLDGFLFLNLLGGDRGVFTVCHEISELDLQRCGLGQCCFGEAIGQVFKFEDQVVYLFGREVLLGSTLWLGVDPSKFRCGEELLEVRGGPDG